jgi:hypothetical protein
MGAGICLEAKPSTEERARVLEEKLRAIELKDAAGALTDFWRNDRSRSRPHRWLLVQATWASSYSS